MGIYNSDKFTKRFIAAIERENITDNGISCPPYSLMTGFIGTAWIAEALSRVGRPDIAYRMLTTKTYPSWLYPVSQGATAIFNSTTLLTPGPHTLRITLHANK